MAACAPRSFSGFGPTSTRRIAFAMRLNRRERAPLLAPDSKEVTLTIDRHRLKFTNLDKIYYPTDGVRKRDLLNYYDAVAPLLLPHLKDRPLSLQAATRTASTAESFFQKNTPEAFPTGCAPRRRRTESDTWSATIAPRFCSW